MYIYIHKYIHTYIHTHIHTYIHTYIQTYIHTYIHAYIHTYINFLKPLGEEDRDPALRRQDVDETEHRDLASMLSCMSIISSSIEYCQLCCLLSSVVIVVVVVVVIVVVVVVAFGFKSWPRCLESPLPLRICTPGYSLTPPNGI